jgi:hypothetical protein
MFSAKTFMRYVFSKKQLIPNKLFILLGVRGVGVLDITDR